MQKWTERCALCGSRASFLDEIVMDDTGARMFVCSDSDYCGEQQARQSSARAAEKVNA